MPVLWHGLSEWNMPAPAILSRSAGTVSAMTEFSTMPVCLSRDFLQQAEAQHVEQPVEGGGKKRTDIILRLVAHDQSGKKTT